VKTFELLLRDNLHSETIPDVVSFVGEDASGSFGILPDHARLLTSLVFGLARFRTAADNWHYLAMPGAILSFDHNVLNLNTRRYLLGDSYEDMSRALLEKLAEEEETLRELKQSLHHIESNVLRQMLEMNKADAGLYE